MITITTLIFYVNKVYINYVVKCKIYNIYLLVKLNILLPS